MGTYRIRSAPWRTLEEYRGSLFGSDNTAVTQAQRDNADAMTRDFLCAAMEMGIVEYDVDGRRYRYAEAWVVPSIVVNVAAEVHATDATAQFHAAGALAGLTTALVVAVLELEVAQGHLRRTREGGYGASAVRALDMAIFQWAKASRR